MWNLNGKPSVETLYPSYSFRMNEVVVHFNSLPFLFLFFIFNAYFPLCPTHYADVLGIPTLCSLNIRGEKTLSLCIRISLDL